MKTTFDAVYRFGTSFDPATGIYCRTNERDAAGNDTGRDPFMASFPHLLDVGIMGHCRHGQSGLCIRSGVECYQDGLYKEEPNMSLADFRHIATQCAGKVFQFALGGRGDPDQHEDFGEILACSREQGIVPNLTSSGLGFNAAIIRLIRDYCGAAAVSWYRSTATLRAIEMLLAAGVRTNIHYVLGDNSIDEAIDLLERGGFPPGINRVIFLLHKPVGLGRRENVLRISDPRVSHFFQLFNQQQYCEMAGFDSCSVPALVNLAPRIDPTSIDSCEGGRFSAYVSPDLRLLPCSFDQRRRWAVDLHQRSIAEAWRSPPFEAFRAYLRGNCPTCTQRSVCLGGCPVTPEVVLCDRPERKADRMDSADSAQQAVKGGALD